jgi:transcriptional regulator with XRE-family HTH domain
MNNLDRIRKELSPERRRKITARANEILAEEMTLRELRKAVDCTQTQVAKILGINQEGVSRLEQRTDLLLSTLRDYVKAMGGELKLVVKLPNRTTIVLSGISEIGAIGEVPGHAKVKKHLPRILEIPPNNAQDKTDSSPEQGRGKKHASDRGVARTAETTPQF